MSAPKRYKAFLEPESGFSIPRSTQWRAQNQPECVPQPESENETHSVEVPQDQNVPLPGTLDDDVNLTMASAGALPER